MISGQKTVNHHDNEMGTLAVNTMGMVPAGDEHSSLGFLKYYFCHFHLSYRVTMSQHQAAAYVNDFLIFTNSNTVT